MLRRRLSIFGILLFAGFSVLAGTTPGEVGKDAQGDPLPEGALVRIGSTRWRHARPVQFAAFLPDGKSVLSVSDDRVVHVWEFPSGKELRRLETPPDPKGKTAIALNRRRALGVPIVLSSDGKTLACGFDTFEVTMYDIAAGKPLPSLKPAGPARSPTNQVTGLEFSPDGKFLAVLEADGSIHIWDWAEAREIRKIGKGGRTPVAAHTLLAYSPDGKWLATLYVDADNGPSLAVKLWDAGSGQEVRSIATADANAAAVTAVFSSDGSKLAFADTAGNVRVVDPKTAKELAAFKERVAGKAGGLRRGPMISLAFSHDGQSLFTRTSVAPAMVREWSITTGKEVRKLGGEAGKQPYAVTAGISATVGRLTVSPDGNKMVVAGFDQMVHFLDVPTGKELDPPNGNTKAMIAVNFSADGKQVWTREAGSQAYVRRDAATGKELDRVSLAGGVVSPTGSHGAVILYSANDHVAVQIRELGSNKKVGSFTPPSNTINEYGTLAFSPDGKTLAARWTVEGKIGFYEVPSGKFLRSVDIAAGDTEFGIGPVAPDVVVFSPDGKTLLGFSGPMELAVWDVPTGRRVKTLPLPETILTGFVSAAFSPDGRCLAFDMPDSTVELYELATVTLRTRLGQAQKSTSFRQRFGDPLTTLVFSPRGDLLAQAGEDGIVHAWNVQTAKEQGRLVGHGGPVSGVAFTLDGSRLVSASTDTTALIWDMAPWTVKPDMARKLPAADLEKHWTGLLDPDATKAFGGMTALGSAPADTVAFLNKHLEPTPPVDSELVAKLLVQLNSEKYKERQQASAELLKIGDRVVPAVEKALEAKPALELRQRLQTILDRLASPARFSGQELRLVRAVELLEHCGTVEARDLLRRLAGGALGALATTQAQAALSRLK
jgi:WD40 repeat protein